MFHGLFSSALAEAAATATPAITAAPEATQAPIDMGQLMSNGLTTTLFGLGGVFLVLFLFYGVIKLMQRVKDKEETDEE